MHELEILVIVARLRLRIDAEAEGVEPEAAAKIREGLIFEEANKLSISEKCELAGYDMSDPDVRQLIDMATAVADKTRDWDAERELFRDDAFRALYRLVTEQP